ncbi:uncharacterized protein IL334_003119 [Kwoniella shivajii]|uniref:DUF974 domain-containing protein n=1 Tax=Kwoniella shivajii TaxID=564305 RepID=A0ABZ1CX06_9TREE|nr:hypothetical protein IL334_003119 [Kwoniella shivajii]
MEPPLSLKIDHISPPSLIPSYIPSSSFPSKPLSLPSPPREFSFSPTPNYPAPFGSVSLGSILSLNVSLQNDSPTRNDVLGVKMMIELQGPSGRYRLGEVIHSSTSSKPQGGSRESDPDVNGPKTDERKQDLEAESESGPESELPALKYGEQVDIHIENEIKDLGLNVIIISVAWETLEGRKTFQRFLKFNVNPPLAIKTRIQTPSHPNTTLLKELREQVYLEVLIQNVSNEGMRLSDVNLEPVQGLKSESVSKINTSSISSTSSSTGDQGVVEDKVSINDQKQAVLLLPEDTRQFLFILSPSPSSDPSNKSSFPPFYTGGTILPLGRLDVTWLYGQYHLQGRLQTSTLNRRVPIPPAQNNISRLRTPQIGGGILPTRSLSSQSISKQNLSSNVLAPSPMRGAPQVLKDGNHDQKEKEENDNWEFDLSLTGDREVQVENKFTIICNLGIRSRKPIPSTSTTTEKTQSQVEGENVKEEQAEDSAHNPPSPPRLAIQYLTPIPAPTYSTTQINQPPQLSVLPPSRSSTPLSPPPLASTSASTRAITPTLNSTPNAFSYSSSGINSSVNSRPMTPLSTQLRQAQSSILNSPKSTYTNIDLPPSLNDHQTIDLASFPPSPYIHPSSSTSPSRSSEIIHVGNSYQELQVKSNSFKLLHENHGPSYSDSNTATATDKGIGPNMIKKWETQSSFELKFIAFNEGLNTLGGVRILLLDSDGRSGTIAREWGSLGDILVVD